MTDFDLPLPTITLDAHQDWQWPRPPVVCEVPASRADGAEPCRIDTASGVSVAGELVYFDAGAGQLSFRMSRSGEPLPLAFDKIRRLTLTTPWRIARPAPGAPVERLVPAAQERSFVANLSGGGSVIGHTHGRVEHDAGMFLFVPGDDEGALLRQFIPRAAYRTIEFGLSDEERAEQRWIATPEALRVAIEAQKQAPIKPLGESLMELGLVSREQLEQTMRAPGALQDMPLGERLVFQGHIDRSELATALAHKMGYPMVNLTSFPVEAEAAHLLSVSAMLEFRALPLMIDGARLIVAVDDLKSIAPLQALKSLAGREVVPVLAPHGRLTVALAQAAQNNDLWAHNVPTQF
jgi:hypothetical protein